MVTLLTNSTTSAVTLRALRISTTAEVKEAMGGVRPAPGLSCFELSPVVTVHRPNCEADCCAKNAAI
jgi:hypothetical protein